MRDWLYKLWRFLNPPKPMLSGIVGINVEQPKVDGVAIMFDNGRSFVIGYREPFALNGDITYADFCAAESQGKRITTTLHVTIKERGDPDG